MKILDSELIKKEENSLLTAMNASFDSRDIQKVFEDQHNIELTGTTILKDSDIVIYNDDVAFKFGFDTTVTFSVMINRDGNYAGLTRDNQIGNIEEETEPIEQIFDSGYLKQSVKELSQTIADSLNKDQLRDLLEKEYGLKINNSLEFKTGRLTIYNDEVIYILEFEAQLNFDLLINRDGNFLSLTDAFKSGSAVEDIVIEKLIEFT
jgi:hypothetical protein